MQRFAALLDRLSTTSARNGKLALITAYLADTPDPDRGYGLAALTGSLSFRNAKAGMVRALITDRVDETLFALSYDYVGDLAETVALLWPDPEPEPGPAATQNPIPSLTEVVEGLARGSRMDLHPMLSGWLDRLDPDGRWALLKLVTGGLRVGVSARLARLAFAQWSGLAIEEIEEVWHGQEPPYTALFAWAAGQAPRPDAAGQPVFRPFMLATPLEERDRSNLDPADCLVEWKWDGIRVQLSGAAQGTRLFSRSGDDISATFPDVTTPLAGLRVTLDGELLIRDLSSSPDDAQPADFNTLQQRLNRKTVSPKQMRTHPAILRVYDLLTVEDADLRPLSLSERRDRLSQWLTGLSDTNPEAAAVLSLSEPLSAPDWQTIDGLQQSGRQRGMEGLMIKRLDSAYVAGRARGAWFKHKRDPLVADAVLLYAQRGHGKRSSFYSDFTFGVWGTDGLVTVGKAYFGFTDAELKQLDRWVRDNTVDRYGPVRAVAPELVLEIAFDSIHPSKRHKSGLAMRFPRIHRIRWDKPATEADRLDALQAMVD